MGELLFNTHDVMLLLTASLAILLALPMAIRPRRREADLLLAGFVLTQGLAALYYVLLFSAAFGISTSELLGILQPVPLIVLYTLQGLLLLWYSYSISGQPICFGRWDRIAIGIVSALIVIQLPPLLMLIDNPNVPWDKIMKSVGTFPPLALSVVYGFRALGVLHEHDRAIRERFSNIDDLSLLWLSYAAFGFIGVWLMRLLAYFPISIGSAHWSDLLGTAANYPTMLLIAVMVTLGLGQGKQRSGDAATTVRDDGQADDTRPPNPALVDKLEHLMSAVKIYQDPDLDVEGLADSMGISPRSLSALVNGHYGKNFYEFVNHYRVEEAKRLLRDPGSSDLTIQRVLENAGFNSKSTFNTFFKKVTGSTPSEYRQSAPAKGAEAPVG